MLHQQVFLWYTFDMSKMSSIQLLPIDHLEPNPFQPRNKLSEEDVRELADSISQYGILEPLVVAHTPAGYQIIAGERRWRAARLAGLTEVPVIIKETTPKEMLEMAIIENVQRTDLTAIERALAFQQLQREFGFSIADVAKRISKSGSYVSNTLKLLTLPDAIKDGLISGSISEGHARAISGIPDEATMVEVYKRILKETASVRRAEELARFYKQRSDEPRFRVARRVYETDTREVEAWERKIQDMLKASAKLKLVRTQQQTKISITIKGDPHQTQKDLEKIMSVIQKA
ncbi:MAG: chromosome partitioning protein ParB [Candidatus Pacebacteria bacterium CG_4_10_14_0_8_um_filter_42_14]|nr:MAG: chromosome partitioning protein ParB [Candidatus Pacebacteria bacterium CG_4_10_14_0_8_um_filter_42_14]